MSTGSGVASTNTADTLTAPIGCLSNCKALSGAGFTNLRVPVSAWTLPHSTSVNNVLDGNTIEILSLGTVLMTGHEPVPYEPETRVRAHVPKRFNRKCFQSYGEYRPGLPLPDMSSSRTGVNNPPNGPVIHDVLLVPRPVRPVWPCGGLCGPRVCGIGNPSLGRFGLAPHRDPSRLVHPGSRSSDSAPTAPVTIGLSSGTQSYPRGGRAKIHLSFHGSSSTGTISVSTTPSSPSDCTWLIFWLLFFNLWSTTTTVVSSPPLPKKENPGNGTKL